MRYDIVSYNKNLSPNKQTVIGNLDKARKIACEISKKAGFRTVSIKNPSRPAWDSIGEVWMNGIDSFAYVSGRAGEGIIWNVNPKTGKLTRKIGYLE